jgi:hypothetical protein
MSSLLVNLSENSAVTTATVVIVDAVGVTTTLTSPNFNNGPVTINNFTPYPNNGFDATLTIACGVLGRATVTFSIDGTPLADTVCLKANNAKKSDPEQFR